jgi:hypothetical protein
MFITLRGFELCSHAGADSSVLDANALLELVPPSPEPEVKDTGSCLGRRFLT